MKCCTKSVAAAIVLTLALALGLDAQSTPQPIPPGGRPTSRPLPTARTPSSNTPNKKPESSPPTKEAKPSSSNTDTSDESQRAADQAQSAAMDAANIAPGKFRPAASRPASGPSELYREVSLDRKTSTRPAPTPRLNPVTASTAEIEESITRGSNLLLAHLQERLQQKRPLSGADVLAVYALTRAGEATGDKRLQRNANEIGAIVDSLRTQDLGGTYVLSLRAAALATLGRPQDRRTLEGDVGLLSHGDINGAYTYQVAVRAVGSQFQKITPSRTRANKGLLDADQWTDNSNSQYGLLGVWAGAEAGIEVPSEYWDRVRQHWEADQRADGQWPYRASQRRIDVLLGSPTMTAAGVASLLVTDQFTEREKGIYRCGREPYSESVRRGLAYCENPLSPFLKVAVSGYALYGVERVGLASGLKFFGNSEWFSELARQTMDRQMANGAWANNLVETSYAILFLSQGRHAIIMNKLRADKSGLGTVFWANRPSDGGGLARFATRALERPITWQIVPLAKDWTDWIDAPILSIGSHRSLRLDDADVTKLRSYVLSGGTLYLNSDQDGADGTGTSLEALAAGSGSRSDEFDRFVSKLAAQLFPEYRYVDIPNDHPLLSAVYKLKSPLKLKGISNGSRLLLVHSLQDQSIYWQKRDEKQGRSAFEFGVNLYVYAVGKQNSRFRIVPTWVSPIDRFPKDATELSVVQLSYAGNWNPEPWAWQRQANAMAWKTGAKLTITSTPIDQANLTKAPLAHLTGTEAHAFTPRQMESLRAYVEPGGVVLIDSCGGSETWNASVKQSLAVTFKDAARFTLNSNHPILLGAEPGMAKNLKLPLRLWSRGRLNGSTPLPIDVLRVGSGAVIFCPVDLTSGILGLRTWGIDGYEPDSAESLVRNILFWIADGKP